MRKTLIYIIGAGRSGTTILDIILGNNGDTISLGEINRFYKRNGFPPQRKKFDNVSYYWNNVKNSFEFKGLIPEKIDYYKLDILNIRNEYHSAIFKSVFNLTNKKYNDYLNYLYDAILENTQENTIIESSKYPLRAINISRLRRKDFDIKYIYLKKDPVKVIQSFNKKNLEQPPKGFLKANIYYLFVNSLCMFSLLILKLKKHKISKLKYENLIKNPIESIDKLAIDLEEDFFLSKEKLKNNKSLNTGFLFDGNRIRLKESIHLQSENKKLSKKGLKYYFTRVFNYIIYRK